MTDINGISEILAGVKEKNRNVLYPMEAESILRAYGIGIPKSIFASNSLKEVIRSAEEIGFPVALKLISPDILHKSDAGCVYLNLNNKQNITKAYNDVLKNAVMHNTQAYIEGFLVQEMIQYGYEIIVGLATDPTFGKIIMFGLGGIFVEILNDVAIRKIPITVLDAQDMIEEIKGYKVLQGARGKEPANFELLKKILLKTSRLGLEIEEIEEMDLNPIFVNAHHALVADPRIIIRK